MAVNQDELAICKRRGHAPATLAFDDGSGVGAVGVSARGADYGSACYALSRSGRIRHRKRNRPPESGPRDASLTPSPK